MTKIDQNLIRLSTGQGQQLCQKWKKSEKLLKSYRVNKNLRPAAAAAYKPSGRQNQRPIVPDEWHNHTGRVAVTVDWSDGRVAIIEQNTKQSNYLKLRISHTPDILFLKVENYYEGNK